MDNLIGLLQVPESEENDEEWWNWTNLRASQSEGESLSTGGIIGATIGGFTILAVSAYFFYKN